MSKIQFDCSIFSSILINLKQNSAYSNNKTTGLTVLANSCIIKQVSIIIQSNTGQRGVYLSVGVSVLTRAELQEPVRGGRGGLSSSPSVKDTHTQIFWRKPVLFWYCVRFISTCNSVITMQNVHRGKRSTFSIPIGYSEVAGPTPNSRSKCSRVLLSSCSQKCTVLEHLAA